MTVCLVYHVPTFIIYKYFFLYFLDLSLPLSLCPHLKNHKHFQVAIKLLLSGKIHMKNQTCGDLQYINY